MSTTKIELTIDEVVVHGLDELQRDSFRLELQRELARVLESYAALGGIGAPSGLRALRSETAREDSGPVAAQVARAVRAALEG